MQALDGVYGRPAAGLRVRLERSADGAWCDVASAETDFSGNVTEWSSLRLSEGLYRIVFDSDYYFVPLGLVAVYPAVTAHFRVHDESDTCKIMVLLSPGAYTTYFGTRS